jgi:hypothetical protein
MGSINFSGLKKCNNPIFGSQKTGKNNVIFGGQKNP